MAKFFLGFSNKTGFIATRMAANNRKVRFGQSELFGQQLNNLFVSLAVLWRDGDIYSHERTFGTVLNANPIG